MKKFYFFLFTIASFLFAPAFSQVNQKGDFQVWLHPIYTHPLTSKLNWSIEEESRWGNDATELYHVFIETFLRYSRAKWIDVGIGYRQSWVREELRNKWHHFYIPMFEVTFRGEVAGWKVADRHRVQYSVGPSEFPDVTYRNRLRVTTPWRIGHLTPFAFNEIFWRERVEGVFENRFATGVTLEMNKRIKTDIYYMLRTLFIAQEWRNMNVFNLFFYLTY